MRESAVERPVLSELNALRSVDPEALRDARTHRGYPTEAAQRIVRIARQRCGLYDAADPLRVVDLGAGTGVCAALLAAAGASVVALEPNASRRAIGVGQTRGADVEWDEETAEDTKLSAGSFHAVVAAEAFGLFEPAAASREALRVLAHAGVLALIDYARPSATTLPGFDANETVVFPATAARPETVLTVFGRGGVTFA